MQLDIALSNQLSLTLLKRIPRGALPPSSAVLWCCSMVAFQSISTIKKNYFPMTEVQIHQLFGVGWQKEFLSSQCQDSVSDSQLCRKKIHFLCIWNRGFFLFQQFESSVKTSKDKGTPATPLLINNMVRVGHNRQNYKTKAAAKLQNKGSQLYKLKSKSFMKCFLNQSQVMKYSQRIFMRTRMATFFCSRNAILFWCFCGRLINFNDNVIIGLVIPDFFTRIEIWT